MKGNRAIFTNQAVTYYRQYDNNLVGLKRLTQESYKKGLQVKKKHYQLLSNEYEEFHDKLKQLLSIDVESIDLESINKRLEFPLWWELIS